MSKRHSLVGKRVRFYSPTYPDWVGWEGTVKEVRPKDCLPLLCKMDERSGRPPREFCFSFAQVQLADQPGAE